MINKFDIAQALITAPLHALKSLRQIKIFRKNNRILFLIKLLIKGFARFTGYRIISAIKGLNPFAKEANRVDEGYYDYTKTAEFQGHMTALKKELGLTAAHFNPDILDKYNVLKRLYPKSKNIDLTDDGIFLVIGENKIHVDVFNQNQKNEFMEFLADSKKYNYNISNLILKSENGLYVMDADNPAVRAYMEKNRTGRVPNHKNTYPEIDKIAVVMDGAYGKLVQNLKTDGDFVSGTQNNKKIMIDVLTENDKNAVEQHMYEQGIEMCNWIMSENNGFYVVNVSDEKIRNYLQKMYDERKPVPEPEPESEPVSDNKSEPESEPVSDNKSEPESEPELDDKSVSEYKLATIVDSTYGKSVQNLNVDGKFVSGTQNDRKIVLDVLTENDKNTVDQYMCENSGMYYNLFVVDNWIKSENNGLYIVDVTNNEIRDYLQKMYDEHKSEPIPIPVKSDDKPEPESESVKSDDKPESVPESVPEPVPVSDDKPEPEPVKSDDKPESESVPESVPVKSELEPVVQPTPEPAESEPIPASKTDKSSVEQEFIEFEIRDDNTAIITGYNSKLTALIIPTTIEYDGKTIAVTEIKPGVFRDHFELEEIIADASILDSKRYTEGWFEIALGETPRVIWQNLSPESKKILEENKMWGIEQAHKMETQPVRNLTDTNDINKPDDKPEPEKSESEPEQQKKKKNKGIDR